MFPPNLTAAAQKLSEVEVERGLEAVQSQDHLRPA
jgi:hypothetical protein